jgi:hypothetical protein
MSAANCFQSVHSPYMLEGRRVCRMLLYHFGVCCRGDYQVNMSFERSYESTTLVYPKRTPKMTSRDVLK